MEIIKRIPIEQAMFVQNYPTTVVNNDFQAYLMELFKDQQTTVSHTEVQFLDVPAMLPSEVAKPDAEMPEPELVQTVMPQALQALWMHPIIPQVQLTAEVDSSAQQADNRIMPEQPMLMSMLHEGSMLPISPQAMLKDVPVQAVLQSNNRIMPDQPMQMQTQAVVKWVGETQHKALKPEFVQMIKMVQNDVQKIVFEPDKPEAQLHFERLRTPNAQIVETENVQIHMPIDVKAVSNEVIVQKERISIDLNAIIDQMKHVDQSKDGTYILKLKPEGVGEIVIKFEQKDNTFRLTLNSPHPEVHSLFEKVLPELKHQMQDVQWEVQSGHGDAQKHEQAFQRQKHKFKQDERHEASPSVRADHYDRSLT